MLLVIRVAFAVMALCTRMYAGKNVYGCKMRFISFYFDDVWTEQRLYTRLETRVAFRVPSNFAVLCIETTRDREREPKTGNNHEKQKNKTKFVLLVFLFNDLPAEHRARR